MKIAMNSVIVGLSIVFSTAAVATAQTPDVLPNADDVVAKMVQQDAQRKSQLSGYTATRHYVAVNQQRKAEMLVKVTCASDGAKQFTILSEEGSGAIRRRVFYKMLKEEEEASSRGTSNSTRITPANYEFQLIGKDLINERPAYLLRIAPKEDNQYLIDGKIWVDATDYSIVRIEGSPARNPSFWTHNVHFVHTYQKVGPFWFAASTHSVSEIRIFGDAELTIENSGYTLNPPDNNTAKADFPARLAR
jgi:outer membrane lipoprotein-sorting protein